MKIFRATAAQLDELADLFDQYRQFYQQQPDRAACREFLEQRMARDESVIFAARNDRGRLVGFTQLYHSFCSVDLVEMIYLYDLFVHPDARRQGVARTLMETAKEHGLERGVGRLQLETAIDNLPAQTLYKDLGWKRDEAYHVYLLELGRG